MSKKPVLVFSYAGKVERKMKVKDVMTKDVQAVNVPGTRDEAMELIKELKVSALPVLKEDTKKLVGIVRLRDFFENPDENQLGMIMNRNVITIPPDKTLEEAAKKMLRNNVRRLPVVEKEILTGIITVRDILSRALIKRENETPILECMQKTVSAIWESTPLKVALEILSLSGKRAIPVLDNDGELAGMIGDEDIMAVSEVETEEKTELLRGRSETEKWTWDSEDRIYITKRSLKPPEMPVEDVMTKDIITVTKRATASKCAKLMEENNLNQIPVATGGKLKGILSDEDLLKVLIE